MQVELNSRRLGGSALLIPFEDAWLESNSCRQLLKHVLDEKLDGSDVLVAADEVKMFCVKQQDNITSSGKKTRVEKELANATSCLDLTVMSVIDAFSTLHFTFKISSLPTATRPPLPNTVDPFVIMRRTQTSFVTLPPRLVHCRMYANHDTYNDLIAFLEIHGVGWSVDTALTDGKRFVESMSKAFFQCTPGTWKALNDKHNSGAFCFGIVLILIDSLFLMLVLVANVFVFTAFVVDDVDVDVVVDVVDAPVIVAHAIVIVALVLLSLLSLLLLSYYYCYCPDIIDVALVAIVCF